MKKSAIFSLLLLPTLINAQIIFSEDFDGVAGTTTGGAGSYSFPTGWLLRNVDNRTPDAQVAYVNEAWERREDFANNVIDSCAFSTSYYSPFGPADDWMWTPLIALPQNAKLKWSALTYDVTYQDGYEVRIMSQNSTPGGPTGGTAAIGNQVTNYTVLFSTTAENSAWTNREVDLAAYAGQSVWIAFRNNSNDQFLLLIDDVSVEVTINYNAAISNFISPEYTQIPINQVVSPPTPFSSTISNLGLLDLTGVEMNVSITDGNNTVVYSGSSAAQNLTAGANASFSVPGFVPTYPSAYTVKAYSSSNEIDQFNSNDTLSWVIYITDSVYARDNGNAVGSLGIGAGNGGYLGQAFTINEADTLTSITMHFGLGYIGENYAAVIWNTQNGVPTSIVGGTDTLVYTSTSFQVNTSPIQGLLILQPGEYVVTAIEFDSVLALANTNEIFTNGKVWVNWPTNPNGTWTNVEAFGSNFAKPFVLRPNFGSLCQQVNFQQTITLCEGESITVGSSIYNLSGTYYDTFQHGYCDSIVETQLTVIPSYVPQINYQPLDQLSIASVTGASYQWIDCDNGQLIPGATDTLFIAQMNGLYAVEVNNNGCIDSSDCIEVIFWGVQEQSLLDFTIYPNPADDAITISSSLSGEMIITNPFGQEIISVEAKSNEPVLVNVDGLASGIYFLHLEGHSLVKRIVIQ